MANLFKILSIDGGGIRGIIPAVLLAEIERRTQRPIAQLFELVAGTSTGGILALGLVKPDAAGKPQYSAEKLIALYETEGARIFSRSLLHEVRAIGHFVEEKYLADFALIDGGVYANNPAMCGFVEAKSTHPEANDFLVVSLGTGELSRPLLYEKAKNWGLVQWAKPLLDVVFHGVNVTVDYQMRQLLPPRYGERRYFRFQTTLAPENNDLDDTSPENLHALKLLAEEIIRDQSDALDILCSQLSE